MNIVPTQRPQSQTIVPSPPAADRHDWLNYFDPTAALRSVVAHVATLPSTTKTPEKHTARVYESGLKYFLAYLSGHLDDLTHPITLYAVQPMIMPSEAVMVDYIGHLSLRGLAASTIANKYMVPARHWLKALTKQRPRVTGEERNKIDDYRASFEDALKVPAPRKQTTSTRSALYRHGNRLTTTQINDLFALLSTERRTLTRLRDTALLYVGLTSALRVAELGRITLNSITPADNCYEITVRGKRNQVDPVAVDSTAVDLINAWVSAWNEAVNYDERQITPDTPIWQPIHRSGKPSEIDEEYDPSTGLSRQSLSRLIKRRTKQALGVSISPHDLRRSYAARAKEAGIDLSAISRQLRHQSIATTQRYIGDPPNPAAGLLTNYVPIVVPQAS